MSGISEIKYIEFFKKKPYLTKPELSLLLGKKGKNLDKKISAMLAKGELVSLKKGLYISQSYLSPEKGRIEEFIANVLYYPSYLSLEYVLWKEGVIPEAVYNYTSVSSKTTRQFTNDLGTFLYRYIKPTLFTGFNYILFSENYRVKIASRAKALFDFLYLRPLGRSDKSVSRILSDLRINWENITSNDLEEFERYTILSKSPKMKLILKILERREL
ncbi:MAG: hypothetical protein UU37_C0003G0018 [Candidatus Gottesmanbacteria bacterium GW2011_GWA2_41_12]|uniref:AbiEi antitoxin C-terminal domain-containing protein n=2 Tax=Candidatus Gottesmaniibacteriota TaxID=1752720 RepID=A0A0G0UHX9_9BACT|nr:MAG: hypothetical protein UT63_C0025G0035 [Candidatus Gottesmanbacteria bacterium GW2011_GWC2_39_8]KKR88444.1 MAG: hypothetical protein UU37_C0003G0018 [Candidatus Gottesmanbacteria bacterium GW2011_GWA2_41_12]